MQRRHPWVFSGAVGKLSGEVQPGDVVDVRAHDGSFLARGFANPQSQLPVRLCTWDEGQQLLDEWLRCQLLRSLTRRVELGIPDETDAYRCVFSESDGLPGLIVDRYGDFVVVQINNHAMERRRERIAELLMELLPARGIFERSDDDARLREGLPSRVGPVTGEAPPALIEMTEHGMHLAVDVHRGHKTGGYLDQRDNRRRAARYLAGERVLNVFSYTGGFAVAALRAGAQHVINLDASAEALRLAEENAVRNGFADRVESAEGNAFELLRRYRDAGATFDAIILDPPRFAKSKAALPKASRGYKDLNLLAIKLLRPGGTLVTFSCSGLVSLELFQQIVFAAALDSGREVRIVERLTQSRCHPVLMTFPEAEYLKGFICRVE